MAPRHGGRVALKIEQLSMLATVVVAFAALAALVLTGQAGLRQDLRALQTDVLAGQAELRKDMRVLRAGQVQLREDLGRLGVRLAVVEHRTDALEVRFADWERRPAEPPVVPDASADGLEP